MLITRRVRSLFLAMLSTGVLCCGAGAQTPTSVTLTLSQSSVPVGRAVLLTAAVVNSSGMASPGQVVFCDLSHVVACLPGSANLLATASVTPGGTASVKVRTGVGVHPIVAHYVGTAGSGGAAPSTSARQTLTVTPVGGVVPTTTFLTSVTQVSSAPGATLYNLAATVSAGVAGPAPVGNVSFLATSPATTTNVGSFALTPAPASPNLTLAPFPGDASQGANAVVADFNEDGAPDVALYTGFGSVFVLAGAGDGSFAAPSPASMVSHACSGSEDYPCKIAIGDFNGDGHADLITLQATPNYSPSYVVQITYGDGKGTFTAGPKAGITLPPGDGAEQILVGDFNGDGLLDLLVNNAVTFATSKATSALALLLQQPDHSLVVSYPKDFGPQGLALGTYVVVGDLNNDGRTDFATASQPGAAEIFLSNGDGSFTGTVNGNPIPVPNNDYINLVMPADFNGDGIPDLALVDAANDQAVVFLNDGHGNFKAGPVLAVYPPSPYAVSFQATVALDVNGDGLADLITDYQSGSGYVDGAYPLLGNVLLSKGDGSFTSVPATLPILAYTYPAVIADVNGDGLPDLIAYANTSTSGTTYEEGVLLNETANGKAMATATNVLMPAGGSLSLAASYAAQGSFSGSASAPQAVTGSSVATALTATVSPATVMVGQPVTVTAKLAPYSVDGFSTDGEIVNFFSYGVSEAGTLNHGVATAVFDNLPAGTVNVFAAYSGDSTFQGSMASSSVVVTTAAASPAALKGTYVFLVKGLLPKEYGPVQGLAALGYFTADGMGNITSGSETVNAAGLLLEDKPVTGSYNIQANGLVTLQIADKQGKTSSFNAVLSQFDTAGIAQQLSLVGLGSENTLLSGEAFAQVSGAASPLTGTYAVYLSGEIFCTPTTCVMNASTTQGALVATETVTGAGVGLGTGTENDAGVVSSLPGLQLAFTTPNANGVFSLALVSLGSAAMEPRYYEAIAVSPTKALLISIEPHSDASLFSGTLSK